MKDIELKLLKLLLNKSFYYDNFYSISHKVLATETKSLIKVIAKLHELTGGNADIDAVYDLYENSATVTQAKLDLVKKIVQKIKEIPELSPEVTLEVIENLHIKEAARQIADKALAIMQRSEDAGTLKELQDFVNQLAIKEDIEGLDNPYTTDVLQIIEDKKNNGVFEFSNGLEFLEKDIGKLSRGHLMILFAPTNAGKSSFVAQLVDGYLDKGHKVICFANEEPANHLIFHYIRSAEGRTQADIINNPSTPIWDRIRKNFILIPAHGKTIPELEKYISKHKPDVIIFDQLDNVQGKVGDKLHETLERLYQKARSIASSANALVIAVSQANDEATGKMVLRSRMLSNSRVGKAGAADLIIGIGLKGMEDTTRCITLCKNKVAGIHTSIYCNLNYEIARVEL